MPESAATRASGMLWTFVSIAIMLVFAIGLGIVAWYMFSVMYAPVDVPGRPGRMVTTAPRGSISMMLLALLVTAGSLFFLAGAVYTFWMGLTGKGKWKEPDDRDSWKEMPFPKD